MPKLGRIAAVVLVVSLVGACGSGGDEAELTVGARSGATATTAAGATPTPTPAPGSVQAACDALTREELASVLGNAVRAPTGQGRNCSWGTAVDKGTTVFLTIIRQPSPRECDVQRSSLARELMQEPVNNVGTSAVWAWQRLTLLIQGTFLACFPNSVVAVMMTGEKDPAVLRGQAATLAQRVQSRL